MTTKPPNYSLLIIASYLPMTVLVGLITFIYTVYLTTYLEDLISNSYNYQSYQQSEAHPTTLIMIHQISQYTNSFAETFAMLSGTGFTSMQKGITYALVLHFLLLMFMISMIRVMKTNPGTVPEDWNSATERELTEIVEIEKKILRNIRVEVRKRKKQEEAERKLLGEVRNDTRPDIENLPDIDEAGEYEQSLPDENLDEPSSGRKHRGQAEFQKQGGPNTSELNGKLGTEPDPLDFDEGADSMDEETEHLTNEKIQNLAIMSALKRSNKRFCNHCQKFKPERAHHCRQCGTCVLKMDHHCPWVSSCIGFYNYKYFMNMVFYGALILLLAAITYSELIQDTIFDPSISSIQLYIMLLSYMLSWCLGFLITLFFMFHMWLILSGNTTLEFCEKKKSLKYNFGYYGNLRRVFGNNWLTWMLPIMPYTEGRGVVFN